MSRTSTVDGGASPVLTPLRAPTFGGRTAEHSGTPPSDPETNSTRYFTASWGSPYQEFASLASSSQAPSHHKTLSEASSESPPLRRLDFHTPYLRPPPSFGRPHVTDSVVPTAVSAAVLANRARRPTRGLTEEWIRQHIAADLETERLNWLSDSNGASEYSSLSGSERDQAPEEDEFDPRTPTLKTFVERRPSANNSSLNLRHLRQLSTETITQADFEHNHGEDSFNMASSGALADLAGLDITRKSIPIERKNSVISLTDKPLPAPPVEATLPAQNPSTGRTTPLPFSKAGPVERKDNAVAPVPLAPRPKKKVPWKGKNIIILLPTDDQRGLPGHAPKPMTAKEVAAMQREWEQLDYDIGGFDLGFSNEGSMTGHGQSKNVWPDLDSLEQERRSKEFRVSIPDRREWDAYVRELSEAKLRALGVSFGDEDPVPPTTLPSLARPPSTQYPTLPFSPPLPSSSATSSHATQLPNPFSPLLIGAGGNPSTNQSSNVGSIASPASMHAQMFGKFNPRQSVSLSNSDHPFGSPFQYPQHPSPGVWTPQATMLQQGMVRGTSPSLNNLGSIVSPAQFHQEGYFPQSDITLQVPQHQHQHHEQMQQVARQSPNLRSLQNINPAAVPSSPSKTPETIVSRQLNPNPMLQKEIDDAEYHLEEQISRQLEHDDYSPHSEKAKNADQQSDPSDIQTIPMGGLGGSRYATHTVIADSPELQHPQPHSRGHSLSQKPFDREDAVPSSFGLAGRNLDFSDMDTKPSITGTPEFYSIANNSHQKVVSQTTNPWLDSDSGSAANAAVPKRYSHSSKPSVSKFNVEAPEFKFDPTSSFKPGQFSFGGPTFQPNAPSFAPIRPTHTHDQTPSTSIQFGNNANVSAPAFSAQNSDFSFSSDGPIFRPDAPAFAPLTGKPTEAVGSKASMTPDAPAARTFTFGRIDMTDVIKPPKKSKAIPIIRPDSSADKPVEQVTSSDKDGNVTQGEGRIKRARGAGKDDNSAPLFAQPNMPLQETNREQSPPKEITVGIFKTTGKENAMPTDVESIASRPTPVLSSRSRKLGVDSLDHDTPSKAPLQPSKEFDQLKQVEDLSAASTIPMCEQPVEKEQPVAIDKSEDIETSVINSPKKEHQKNSLSALAKPFAFGSDKFELAGNTPSTAPSAGLRIDTSSEVQASAPAPNLIPARARAPSVTQPQSGLSSSRYAVATPTEEEQIPTGSRNFAAKYPSQAFPPPSLSPDSELETEQADPLRAETSFEEIDDVMRHMNQAESANAASWETDTTRYHQLSLKKTLQFPDANSSPLRLQGQNLLRSDAPSPTPRRFHTLPGDSLTDHIFSRAHTDPFINDSDPNLPTESPIHNLNRDGTQEPSDWDSLISESEDVKLHARARFFDTHVNELVGGLIDEKLDPMERALEAIQQSLLSMNAIVPFSRARRSRSAEVPESDADDEDEDEDEPYRHSLSPRKDNKLEKIRSVVIEALESHNSVMPLEVPPAALQDSADVIKVLKEIREQFDESIRLDLRGEELRNIVESAVEKRVPNSSIFGIEESASAKVAELEAKIAEMAIRLETAETKTAEEVEKRRAIEDRLAEDQRLLRISSEEENRLRQLLVEKEQNVKDLENFKSKNDIRTALLEANAESVQKSHKELSQRLTTLEMELRDSRQEAQHWRVEAERASEAVERHSADADHTKETNISLRLTVDRFKLQLEESLHTRENMRRKLDDLQQGMAEAAHDVSQENAHRTKKEQELIARQEVLNARLEAEGRTRERLEHENARLEQGERESARAVEECKRLEVQLLNLKTELDEAQRNSMRFKREFEEARESGLSEVQRTRNYMQIEVDTANNQVNLVRQDLEDQIARLRSDLDNVKLDADTAKAKHEMLFEEAMESKIQEIENLNRRHANEIDDIETRHTRQLDTAVEDAARSEQLLLERLSLSSAKTEHLQDRVTHLEEKLEIARAAAHAAAQSARSPKLSKSAPQPTHSSDKISPQALRESVMVLQEQLQAREHTIEQLEQRLAIVDEGAPTKISKRDDEIIWLRELLAVRIGDLQDIINTVSQDEFDSAAVKDAAIRLKANLQMEEQERERAMNGGSSINLPNIAATIKDAASPKVAQVVGPMAAAWGNWRKTQVGSLAEMMTNSSTPIKAASPRTQSFLSGLMTPPSNSKSAGSSGYGKSGKRFTEQELANRPSPRRPSARREGKTPALPEPSRPSTPPIMRPSSYDEDAEAGDYSDAGYYDDASTVDDGITAR